jgi:hypothetical protein
MKSLLKRIALACAYLISSISVFSQTNENFDSREGVDALQVKDYLEDHCWQFTNFNMNAGDVAALKGDGSIVSGGGAASFSTPVLSLWSGYNVSFSYVFAGTATERRSINIYLANGSNEIIRKVDSIDVSAAEGNTIYTYSKALPAAFNVYKLYFSYEGAVMPVVKIDDIKITAHKRYPNGCNAPPTAMSDVIYGSSDRRASGSVLENDTDPNLEALACYLMRDSKDGKVTLSANGTFSFSPNPDFDGDYTSFTYQTCDYGYNQLCSEEATVIISFPNMLPAVIVDLQASHNNNKVTLKWATTTEKNTDHFEIERSVDGVTFEKAGRVKALGNSTTRHNYLYHDEVSEKMTRKNDLYYRLKQVDADGKTEYSRILLVRVFNTRTLQAVTVSPNPAINNIRVQLQLNQPAYVVMKIRSLNGSELIRNTVKAYKGENSFTLVNSESLKKGVYMLEVIINSNERMVVKLLKN